MDEELLMDFRGLASVKHHIPGRLRLVLDPAIRNHPRFDEMGEHTDAVLPGMLSARVNLLARSLVVEYDVARTAYETVQEFFTTTDDERARAIARDFVHELKAAGA